jgi:hypothetical protein
MKYFVFEDEKVKVVDGKACYAPNIIDIGSSNDFFSSVK